MTVDTPFASKLALLGFKLPEWCFSPSAELVRDYEQRFALTLPADYRAFLVHHGGVVGSATCAFQEPTPCGTAACVDKLYGFTREDRHDDVNRATEDIDGAPVVVAIGENLMGDMLWLKCSGRDCGSVYMHDHEGRFAWPDDMFYNQFPNLHQAIKDYLDLRKRAELPKKPTGYEHIYRVATSFTDFIERLEPQGE